MKIEKIKKLLDETQEYANLASDCLKVAVGSMLCINGSDEKAVLGANKTLPVSCRETACQREELYGESSKLHRLPSDCRAIHSEIDAICNAAKFGFSTKGGTMLVTRYPCEACARAIVDSGIKQVYYGRQQEISEQTKTIFEKGQVKVTWVKDWIYEDTEE